MLTPIVKALNDFNENGLAVIENTEGVEAKEIAEYVVQLLNDLKCSFDHYYLEDKQLYIIRDNVSEPAEVEITKCDYCGEYKLSTNVTYVSSSLFSGNMCRECVE